MASSAGVKTPRRSSTGAGRLSFRPRLVLEHFQNMDTTRALHHPDKKR
ncbi:MAG: hypothetical protein H6672_02100 [Anaerolineaceae bacterium]|nr:hypothetical protein [Anaerolineaceae bacterium]